MISEKQRLERLNNFSKILTELSNCNSIGEISVKTGIPTSTIQRYLNDEKLYVEFFDYKEKINIDIKEYFNKVKDILKQYKQNGLSKGGKTSQELHGYSKDEIGKFKGSNM